MINDVLVLAALVAIGLIAIVFARSRARAADRWQTSKSGNPTAVIRGRRVTVFPSNGGWKYVIADGQGGDDDPDFSDAYETAEQAKFEALAFISGEPSGYRSMRERKAESRQQRRRKAWEAAIENGEQLIAEVANLLGREDLNVKRLRKLEARIASRLKALGWQMPHYQADGVKSASMAQAERQKATLQLLKDRVEARIAEVKASRTSRARE